MIFLINIIACAIIIPVIIKEDYYRMKFIKMKKQALLVALMAALMSFTACGETESSKVSETEIEATTEQIAETEADTTAAETEEVTEPAEESVVSTEPKEFTPVEGLSKNYADLEQRCFAYNGKIFTLGKSTLQDLIDGGIPFSENELNNSGNNVNKNYESSTYTVRINDYVSLQLTFVNITDSNIPESECLLKHVRWYSIYVPQPDYEDSMNEEITNNINDAATHICFSFPLTLTKDQLLENNSDATEITDNNYVKYTVDSEVYMGTSGYNFEFNQNTDQLKEVNISWLP